MTGGDASDVRVAGESRHTNGAISEEIVQLFTGIVLVAESRRVDESEKDAKRQTAWDHRVRRVREN